MSSYTTGDTICALSTPEGVGAIGVLRLSGDKAIAICDTVFKGKKLSEQAANTLHFGRIVDGEREVDEVVVGIFKGPNSYTGEDIVEISCHGSPFIQKEVLELLVRKGARTAKEGEFTLRAFLNGKIDLSQAEAVADLIASKSRAAHDLALNQLRGGYSNRLKDMREKLIHFASMLELELDFSEEDVDFANRDELKGLIEELRKEFSAMMKSFEQGNVIKNGVPVAIIGEPNVGKSTLLNAILKEERAIVSDIPGTTRDFIEDDISIGGVLFRFIDTAGLRETNDEIEGKGIERAKERARNAKIVLKMIDGNSEFGIRPPAGRAGNLEFGGEARVFKLVNKIDLLDGSKKQELLNAKEDDTFFISAKTGEGVEELLDALLDTIRIGKAETGGVVVSNVRHLEALQQCDSALERSLHGIESGVSSDLVAMDVRQALHYLGEITGEVSNEDLLGNIFSKFCIGK